jgi:hypothetical protein
LDLISTVFGVTLALENDLIGCLGDLFKVVGGVILERQPNGERIRFTAADRALLAALQHRLPGALLRQIRPLVRPETVLRWHRDLIGARHARISRPKRVGRPRRVRSIHTLVLRLARENSREGVASGP